MANGRHVENRKNCDQSAKAALFGCDRAACQVESRG